MNARHPIARLNTVLLTAALLAACGGGGGTSDPIGGAPPDQLVDAQDALTQWVTGSGSWSVAGRGSDGRDYSATLSIAPGVRAAYPLDFFGTVGRTSVQRATLNVAGFDPIVSSTTVYVPDFSALPLGFAYDDGSCASVQNGSSPPAEAAVGAGDLMLSVIEYDGCDRATAQAVGFTEVRWSLEAIDGRPYFCLRSVYFEDPGRVPDGSSDTTCVEVDSAGRLGTRAVVRLQAPGFTLEMKG